MKKFAPLIASLLLLLATSTPVKATDLVETAASSGTFKTFVSALRSAGFADTLKTSGPYTVFAPTDEAFSKLPPGTWEALSKDKVRLAKVLANHVVPGETLIAEVRPGNVKSTQGDMLKLTSDNGKVTVNDANVIESDLKADNGVIHALDTVLLPAAETGTSMGSSAGEGAANSATGVQ